MSDRPVGLTRDVGYQIGVRRTFEMSPERAWKLIASAAGQRAWLGGRVRLVEGAAYRLPDGTEGEIRVRSDGSHLRLTWRPRGWERASTMQVRVIPSGERAVVAFHQEHLRSSRDRERRREHFKAALEELRRLAGKRSRAR